MNLILNNDLLIQLTSISVLFIINYLKYRTDIKTSIRKTEANHDYIKSEIKFIKKTLKRIESEHDYEKKLYDDITERGFNIITANIDLDGKIIHILNHTLIKIREFAIKHSNSPYRHSKDVIRDYLKIESGTIFSEIDRIADDLFQIKGIKGIQYNYSKFIREFTDIEIVIGIMIKRLVDNGLEEEEYIKLFENFISDLFAEQIKAWRAWIKKY